MKAIIFVFASILATIVANQRGLERSAPLRSVRGGVARYQAPSGGFKNQPTDEHPTAEATQNALLIVSLFGLRTQINAYDCSRFLSTLENSDGGYGSMPGRPSDMASVRDVVLSYAHLGLPIQSQANVVAYIKTLRGPAGTFSSRLGEKPDLESTFFALEALELLGESRIIDEVSPLLQAYLADRATATHFEFEDEDMDALVANYYGMMIAKFIHWSIPSVDDWKAYLFRTSQLPESTITSVAAGFISLYEIDPANTLGSHIEAYLASKESQSADGLRDAAAAYRAIVRSADGKSMVNVHMEFDTEDRNDDSFVQGASVRPLLLTRTSLGNEHPGLDVEVTATYESEDPVALKLQWSPESHVYQSYNTYPTDAKLGSVNFEYAIRYYVASVGEIVLDDRVSRYVGYGIDVQAEAEQTLLGRKVAAGEEVAAGTNFQFTVALRNSTDSISKGNFEVVFDILDASRVVLFTESVDGNRGASAFNFKYELKDANIPAGPLSFRVGVREKTVGVIHSSRVVQYLIATPMVASQLDFEGGKDEYMIGSDVVITMVPASYDLQSVHPFSRLDARNTDISSQRQFFVDLVTAKGDVVFSAAGRPIQDGTDHLKLRFVIPVSPTLDFIGFTQVQFHYIGANGESQSLTNFNSASSQLYDAASPFGFSVRSELTMIDVVEKPKPDADFFYGNDISFQFRLQDAISERTITASERGFGKVFLTLQHATTDDTRPFTSVKEPATMEDDYFSINWAINPNAVSGDGMLIVAAEDASGQLHSISDNGVAVKYPVKIGGNIDVSHKSFSTDVDGESAFIVDFSLYCNGKVLNDAVLKSTVSILGKDGKQDPFIRTPVATSAGRYQASWTAKEAPSGTYVLNFYRETDLARAAELRAQKERQSRTGKPVPESDSDIEAAVKPLFKVEIKHEAAPRAVLPVRTEVFVIGGLLLAWLAMLSEKP